MHWHDANEATGLMNQDCSGRYLPSDFYSLAMGESAGRPTAANPRKGMHGMTMLNWR